MKCDGTIADRPMVVALVVLKEFSCSLRFTMGLLIKTSLSYYLGQHPFFVRLDIL